MRTTMKLALAGLGSLALLAGGVAWVHVGGTRPTMVSRSDVSLGSESPSRLAKVKPGAGPVASIQRGVPVAASGDTTASAPVSTTGHLRVHVVAASDGRPLADVAVFVGHRVMDQPAERIEIVRGEEYLRTLRTNANGNAECELQAATMYSATALVEIDGSWCHTTNWTQIGADLTTELELRAGPSAHPSCKGTVIDRDTGMPVGGATVSGMDGGEAVTTSVLGEFALDASGSWYQRNIHVDAAGYSPVLAQLNQTTRPRPTRGAGRITRVTGPAVTKESIDPALTVFLRREAFLDGWLLDPAGAPVVETRIHAESSEEPADGTFDIPIVTTDDKGHFDFGRVPSGVMLSVGPKMSGTLACDVTLLPGEKRSLTVRAQPYVELSGRVLDEHDEPIVEGGVSARCGDRTDEGTIRSDGTYYMPFLGPGHGRVNVLRSMTGNSANYTCALEIPAGVTEWTLDLRPTPMRSITGRVVAADGGVVIGARVELDGPFGSSGPIPIYDTTTGEDGAFEFASLMPGTYEVFCTQSEPLLQSARIRVVAGDGPVELHMPDMGTIHGRVRFPPGLAATTCSVQFESAGQATSASVEENGTFRTRVALGRISIVAQGGELTSAILSVDVGPDGETEVPDLVLEPTARLRLIGGRVESPTTLEVRRGNDLFFAGRLASNADQVITVPCGNIRVTLKNGSKDEAYEVALAVGELRWLAVLRGH